VGNIAARGIIRTAVFQKDVVSAVGGNLAVLPADLLNADMTANDESCTLITESGDTRITEAGDTRIFDGIAGLTLEGNETFSVGSFIRIKDGTDDEWMEVVAESDPNYGVVRDKGGDYSADSNPAWKKGASVINFGASGEGAVYMTSSETNAPYLSVFTHAGSPWDTLTTRLRLGNLNGYLGYSSDAFGLGIGSSSANQANLTFDPTNGLRLRTATTDKIVFDNSGNAYIADSVTIGGASGVLASTLNGWKHTSDTTKIDGGDIYTNTVTATQISVDDLAAINADLGSITAGNITLDTSGFIKTSGKDSYNDSTAGFFIGYSGDAYQSGIGDGTNYLTWDGSTLIIAGTIAGVTAGDVLEAAGDSVETSTSSTYVKLKTIYIGRSGTYRVKFDMKSSLVSNVYGRVYKDGTGHGTERISPSLSYVTYSQDLAFDSGDECQLYVHITAASGNTVHVKNFRVYVANPIVSAADE